MVDGLNPATYIDMYVLNLRPVVALNRFQLNKLK